MRLLILIPLLLQACSALTPDSVELTTSYGEGNFNRYGLEASGRGIALTLVYVVKEPIAPQRPMRDWRHVEETRVEGLPVRRCGTSMGGTYRDQDSRDGVVPLGDEVSPVQDDLIGVHVPHVPDPHWYESPVFLGFLLSALTAVLAFMGKEHIQTGVRKLRRKR